VRRILGTVLAVLAAIPFARSGAAPVDPCVPRLLVLSAFPGEIDMLLTQADIDGIVTIDGRRFFVGELRGNEVVLALSGIGLVNAEETTTNAFGYFRCGGDVAITGVVFSGVSGGLTNIGDVSIPDRWTLGDAADPDAEWFEVDEAMFATAQTASVGVTLTRRVPLGDLACVGIDPATVRTIRMPNAPKITFGGNGKSADSFGGRAWPCIPGGGDIFGCEPCRAPRTVPDVARFVEDARPFADPDFFLGYFDSPPPATTDYAAEDMETAAVFKVAEANGIPFIAFRALSDGKGDPLHLPDFPAQFFFYRQLAADNAALVALAFLEAWGAG
jgi:nucleoside phosphorylase